MSFQKKYLKYKNKYLNLKYKNQKGGSSFEEEMKLAIANSLADDNNIPLECKQEAAHIQGFIYEYIYGDGNCLYSCIARHINKTHVQVRDEIVNYIDRNRTHFNTGYIDEYLHKQRQPGEYGDYITILAAVALYNIHILVYTMNYNKTARTCSLTLPTEHYNLTRNVVENREITSPSLPSLYLSYESYSGIEHYGYLLKQHVSASPAPKPPASPAPKPPASYASSVSSASPAPKPPAVSTNQSSLPIPPSSASSVSSASPAPNQSSLPKPPSSASSVSPAPNQSSLPIPPSSVSSVSSVSKINEFKDLKERLEGIDENEINEQLTQLYKNIELSSDPETTQGLINSLELIRDQFIELNKLSEILDVNTNVDSAAGNLGTKNSSDDMKLKKIDELNKLLDNINNELRVAFGNALSIINNQLIDNLYKKRGEIKTELEQLQSSIQKSFEQKYLKYKQKYLQLKNLK